MSASKLSNQNFDTTGARDVFVSFMPLLSAYLYYLGYDEGEHPGATSLDSWMWKLLALVTVIPFFLGDSNKLRVASVRNEEIIRKRRADMQVKFQGAEPAGPGTALIAFELPCGARRQRRFWPTDTVQVLYDYLEAFGDIEFDQFEIATNLPKVVYNDRFISLEAAGLSPQAMLFVFEKL